MVPPQEDPAVPAGLRSFRVVLRELEPTLRLVLEADRTSALLIGALGILGGLLPLAVAYVGRLIVDAVVASMGGDPDAGRHAVLLVAAEAGLMAAGLALTRGSQLSRALLGLKLGHLINLRILAKAAELELAHFEDPKIYDRLQNARREASSRPLNVFSTVTGLLRDLLTLATIALALVAFSPAAVLALALATLPSFFSELRFSREAYRLFSWRAPEGRRMKYLEWLLTRDREAKEVKLFGLADHILGLYRELYGKFYREDRSLAFRRAAFGFGLGLLSTGAFYGTYAWIVLRTAAGGLTLGEMTFYLAIFRQGQTALRDVLMAVGSSYEDGLFMSNLFSFLRLDVRAKPSVHPASEGAAAVLAGEDLRRASTASARAGERPGRITFEDVSFTYPGARRPVLSGFSLAVEPGEKIALVGANGAGKSTLVKLLTGLYHPTSGRIELDGVPLDQLPSGELRRRFAVVLQDYVTYQFSAGDNIGLGDVAHLHDRDRILRAAESGDALELVRELPRGLDTQLGRWFDGGTELSTGQWQKLAVSRAFMREAEVLILDEPSASLDAEAEHRLFERFQALAKDKTAFLISHRFSTVRMADRIVVLADGMCREVGSHESLLALGGRYAELFRLQARGYVEGWRSG